MPQANREWTVLPHGSLTRLDDALFTVVGELHMPLGDFPRRMTVVRLAGARPRLVVFNAISLDEPEMRALEAEGEPAFLVVPSDIHRLDARAWKDRYPRMRVITPAGAREKVEEVVAVDATAVDFGDASVKFVTVAGTDAHEGALVVERPSGTTLVLNDLIWNVDDRPGLGGWAFRVAGFTGPEPRIPAFVELKAIKDKDALCAQLVEWAALPRLERILVAHGDVITRDPAAVLRGLADALA